MSTGIEFHAEVHRTRELMAGLLPEPKSRDRKARELEILDLSFFLLVFAELEPRVRTAYEANGGSDEPCPECGNPSNGFLHQARKVLADPVSEWLEDEWLEWLEDMYKIRNDIAHGRGARLLARNPPIIIDIEDVHRRVSYLIDLLED